MVSCGRSRNFVWVFNASIEGLGNSYSVSSEEIFTRLQKRKLQFCKWRQYRNLSSSFIFYQHYNINFCLLSLHLGVDSTHPDLHDNFVSLQTFYKKTSFLSSITYLLQAVLKRLVLSSSQIRMHSHLACSDVMTTNQLQVVSRLGAS